MILLKLYKRTESEIRYNNKIISGKTLSRETFFLLTIVISTSIWQLQVNLETLKCLVQNSKLCNDVLN